MLGFSILGIFSGGKVDLFGAFKSKFRIIFKNTGEKLEGKTMILSTNLYYYFNNNNFMKYT